MENLARHENRPSDAARPFPAALLSMIAADGSISITVPLAKFLASSRDSRDLRSAVKSTRPALIADIAHFLCISHGRQPGIVDHAATKIVDDEARGWLLAATQGFSIERAYLTQLTVAAGPIARQQGQEKITAVLTNQAKSFAMLATSDRNGCAAGSAIAFVLDWQNTRPLIDECALSLGIEPPKCGLPSQAESTALADILSQESAKQRAMTFGVQQMLAQQRGLWQLIAARHTEMTQAHG